MRFRRGKTRQDEGGFRIPIYDDVVRGSGGLYTFHSTDTLIDNSYDALIDSDGTFIVQDAGGSKILLNG